MTEDSHNAMVLAATNAAQAAALAASTASGAAEKAATIAKDAAVASAVVSVNIDNIKANIKDIKDTLKDMSVQYVTKEEFSVVKSIVYGFVALILIAVVGGIIALVVHK